MNTAAAVSTTVFEGFCLSTGRSRWRRKPTPAFAATQLDLADVPRQSPAEPIQAHFNRQPDDAVGMNHPAAVTLPTRARETV